MLQRFHKKCRLPHFSFPGKLEDLSYSTSVLVTEKDSSIASDPRGRSQHSDLLQK